MDAGRCIDGGRKWAKGLGDFTGRATHANVDAPDTKGCTITGVLPPLAHNVSLTMATKIAVSL